MGADWQVMVASADSERLRRVEDLLRRHDVGTICSSTLRQCREILTNENIGLVFCDQNLPDGDYRDLLVAAARESTKGTVRIVLMSGLIDGEDYQKAKRLGIFEIISTPCRPTDLEWMLIRAKRDKKHHTLNSMFGN